MLDLEPYLERLRELAFVDDVQVLDDHDTDADGAVLIDTPTGREQMLFELSSSHLGYATAAHLLQHMRTREVDGLDRWLLLAPRIGAGLAAYLRSHDVSYLDRVGNCHLRIGDQYIAQIEGRRPARLPPQGRGIGAAGYRVLFALLATPDLLPLPVRRIAEHTGVNRQTVAQMIERLIADGIAVRGKRPTWVEGKRRRALDQLLAGYHGTLRPKLWLGAFETPDGDPGSLRRRIAPLLSDALTAPWRWGGQYAGHLLNGCDRGDRAVVHVDLDRLPSELPRTLRAVPAKDGPLLFLGVPGPEALKSPHADTVHPLLVWAEMMTSANERAREAAGEPISRQLKPAAGQLLSEYHAGLEP